MTEYINIIIGASMPFGVARNLGAMGAPLAQPYQVPVPVPVPAPVPAPAPVAQSCELN